MKEFSRITPECLTKWYRNYDVGRIASDEEIARHPDTPIETLCALQGESAWRAILENPALPLHLLANPDVMQCFDESVLRAWVNDAQTPAWTLWALQSHPNVHIAQGAVWHRTVAPPFDDWATATRTLLCSLPVPLRTNRDDFGNTFTYPDDTTRRQFACVPGLPAWVYPLLRGNPERAYTPERIQAMLQNALKGRDVLLFFLAFALWKPQSVLSSPNDWAAQLAMLLRLTTPDDTVLELTESPHTLVHAAAEARLAGEDIRARLWDSVA
jgi:hypothetical protein